MYRASPSGPRSFLKTCLTGVPMFSIRAKEGWLLSRENEVLLLSNCLIQPELCSLYCAFHLATSLWNRFFSCSPNQQRPQQHLHKTSVRLVTDLQSRDTLSDFPPFFSSIYRAIILETFNIIGFSYLSGLTTSKWCIRKRLGGGFGSDIFKSCLQMQQNAHMSQI